jgi:hypothetical protein
MNCRLFRHEFGMWRLKHLIGGVGLAITLDYFLFNGYCTNATCEAFSDAYAQFLSSDAYAQFLSLVANYV